MFATCCCCWNKPEGEGGGVPTGSFGSEEGHSQYLYVLITSWTLRQELVKYAVKPLPVKDWEMDIFCLNTEPQGDSHDECLCVCPFKTAFLFATVLCATPIGYQSQALWYPSFRWNHRSWGTGCMYMLLWRGAGTLVLSFE